MDIARLIQDVFAGPNAAVFTAANIIAIFVYRRLGVPFTMAFGGAAIICGLMGALAALVETTAKSGQNPTAEINAALVGLIMGAGSSLVIAYVLRLAIRKLRGDGKKQKAPPPPSSTAPPP